MPGIFVGQSFAFEDMSQVTPTVGAKDLNPVTICICLPSVSYTHLTLPTNREV